MARSSRNSYILLLAILIVTTLGVIWLVRRNSEGFTPSEAATTPTAIDSYDPAAYGLPPMIAGYRVLVVLTSENTACMLPGHKRIVMQAPEPDVDSYFTALPEHPALQVLRDMGLDMTKWEIEVGGPGTTREQIISENEKWNSEMTALGCITLGGPIITITPT